MATPRIFVSSTCYDLQEIRSQLHSFINEFGYEPVMSEFGDIFYDYALHVQDSCIEEIKKCQLFILVIGNNYGSIFHSDKKENLIPDSITLKEFRKAIEYKIPKHIFINKFVDYDYRNYKRVLDNAYLKHFKENETPDSEIEQTKLLIKLKFDRSYSFAFESYQYIFYFLDIIHDLKHGNGYNTFETFNEIKLSLKKQWAGFMFESLSKNENAIELAIKPLEGSIKEINDSIKLLLESKINIPEKNSSNENKISFDVEKLTSVIKFEEISKIQEKIDNILNTIFMFKYEDDFGYEHNYYRLNFDEKVNDSKVFSWINSLHSIINTYKWSKEIHVNILFQGMPISYINSDGESVPYLAVFEFSSIAKTINSTDKLYLSKTVQQFFEKAYKEKITTTTKSDDSDDLPF